MTTYTITTNAAYNSIEISFTTKPSDAIRDALKALKFRWHGVKKVWYGFATEEEARAAIESASTDGKAASDKPERKSASAAEKVNKYGVKVGDMFSASWGYEQTNVNFFQVVALVGETSVRVREVYPEMIADDATGPMSADRTYKITSELLPPATHATFIKDQERGDVKRLKPGWYNDPQKALENCHFKVESFANAYKCNGSTEKVYESWYA